MMPRHPNARLALLEAAERIFAERGLAGARTEEIVAAAGVNKALLYYYFESKEKLFDAVLESLFQRFLAEVEGPLTQVKTPRASLLAYVEAHFRFLAQHPNYPRLFQRELMSGGPRLRHLVRRYLRPVYGGLRRLLQAGIRRREFRRLDVDNTVISLIGMTVFYFAAAPVLSVVLDANPYDERRVAARQRAVVDFLEHALAPSPRRRER